MSVFLDTNVLVAAFATRGLCEDVFRTVLIHHQLVVGETVMVELERVLIAKLRMPARQAKQVVAFVRTHAEVSRPAGPAAWPAGDPDDRWVVAAAIEAGVDVLVTGDRTLLAAADQAPFPLVSPRGFWEQLR